MSPKVALITGGASGMGLAVAEALSKRNGEWELHLLDLNVERGNAAAKSLNQTYFHSTNVTSYSSLSKTFNTVFNRNERIDFVFANAGIVERDNFYAKHEQSPPPEPNQLSIDVDLKSVVSSCYLAQHYFRLSPKDADKSLVMTASCGGLYPSPFCPMYVAAKHGVVGLTRSIAKHYFLADRIRVNCICPGTVRTNLLDSQGWANFPDEYFTPIEKVVEVVVALVDGGEYEDAWGQKEGAKENGAWGQAVEVNGTKHYFRRQPEWCDEAMRMVMEATDVHNQVGAVLKN